MSWILRERPSLVFTTATRHTNDGEMVPQSYIDQWARVVAHGIPVPAFMNALAYYDGYRHERLPANLLQAQRDYFGAHTYERLDKPGAFHTDWIALRRKPS